MIDLVQTQADITALLLSVKALASVNVKSYRAMRLAQELDYRTMLTTPRNGKVGAAIIVLMPVAQSRNPNAPGPVLGWEFPIVVQELDQMNMQAVPFNVNGAGCTGTLLSAEEIGQIVMDALHHECDEAIGTFVVSGRAMDDEREFVFPGCVGYRVSFTITAGRATQQTPRVSPVNCSVDNGTVTLTCATSDAIIRYTTDGSFPGAERAEQNTVSTYREPFFAQSETVIRAAAYKDGMNKSATRNITI